RTLAFVILPNGTDYNEQEVADGYACVYKYHGRKSKELSEVEWERLNKLMDNARRNRLGLWGKYPGIMECLCK
ncbi:MAG: hypothetical protein GWP10_06505, partial [Nitrospiraceae bacterium]|nr:hypothetical protein [Nitrospiraceae bacterium]